MVIKLNYMIKHLIMKNKTTHKWLAVLFISIAAISQNSYAQTEAKRLPDGTIIYSDGSIRRPNGEVKYPNNNGTNYPKANYPTARYPRGTRRQDGSIIYPDGSVKYPNGSVRYPNGTVKYPNNRNNNYPQGLPPGQAKKRYGGNARDYAPGHNKNKNHDYDREDDNKKDWKNNGNRKHKHDD